MQGLYVALCLSKPLTCGFTQASKTLPNPRLEKPNPDSLSYCIRLAQWGARGGGGGGGAYVSAVVFALDMMVSRQVAYVLLPGCITHCTVIAAAMHHVVQAVCSCMIYASSP